jgi:AraC-like DNA-binding protein
MKATFKAVPKENCSLFRIEKQETNQEFDYPWHYHPEYELTFISNSQGVRYVGNNMENFSDRDLVLLGSNLPHCWINSGQDEFAKAIVIFLNEDFINWLNNGQFPHIVELFKNSSKGIKFSKEVASNNEKRLTRMLEADPFEKFIILMQMLNDLASQNNFDFLTQNGFSYELNLSNNERINAVYQFVSKNFGRKISLSEVAAHVNMSNEYFSRFFSKTMMKSFFTFLNEYRINRACKLLIETDKSINDICYKSGFESIPFFYRQFKKFKSSQPKSFRQQYQKAFVETSNKLKRI